MRTIILLTLIGLFLSTNVFSQRTRVSGIIIDGETGNSLPGASILIEGTATGTVTDLAGNYSILVPGEESVLVFSFIGYLDQQITVGNQRTINVQLEVDIANIEEVVITLQAKGQIGAQQRQINSSTIVNVVAPDRLQENPDANAVEAIGRLPGVSVLRDGGEGNALVIRGLEPRYSNVTLDGLKLPSTSTNDRMANISGISQYALQGVEVFKALTPDMEANSVGGTVNLQLQGIPDGFHFNVMAQGGYNNLNNYFGNYKLLGEASNRFFNNKLGMFFSVVAENVNRSVETMSASYSTPYSEGEGHPMNSTVLNKITNIKSRASATFLMDYQIHPSTKLKLYGMYTHSGTDYESQSKGYNLGGAGSVSYSQRDNPFYKSDMLHTALRAETKLGFLNMVMDYGIALSYTEMDDPDSRSWAESFKNASSDEFTTLENRLTLDPTEVIPLFNDHPDSLHNLHLSSMTIKSDHLEERNLNPFLNIKIPYQLGSSINGYIKFGGMYRSTQRKRDATAGGLNVPASPYFITLMPQTYDWCEVSNFNITMNNVEDYMIKDFLNGQYDFGWYFNTDRLNDLTTFWNTESMEAYALGEEYYLPIFFSIQKMGFAQDIKNSMINDQDILENYGAGYLMSEINYGNWLMFMPGLRYEFTDASMDGFYAVRPQSPGPTFTPLPGSDTSATRSDAFLLPMLHLRIKPSNKMYIHLAYTQTLSRPDFNSISPNIYVGPGVIPHVYVAQNPELNAEFWTNYDAQLTLHSNKVGLLSVSGFYKTVHDKIWNRTFKRLSTDPPIYPYGERAVVDVSIWENHPYDIVLNGVEIEWQTSFWYLPSPLKYFTMNLNYTFVDSKTKYPHTRIDQVIPPAGGRPVAIRIDSTTTGPMLFQPRHILNASLGFNLKGFNVWLSFQYNGEIYTYKHYVLDDLDRLKEKYYRLDLQVAYKIPVGIPGSLQVIGNFANLTNFTETSRLRGEPRFTYEEAYGWTADLGIRYRF